MPARIIEMEVSLRVSCERIGGILRMSNNEIALEQLRLRPQVAAGDIQSGGALNHRADIRNLMEIRIFSRGQLLTNGPHSIQCV